MLPTYCSLSSGQLTATLVRCLQDARNINRIQRANYSSTSYQFQPLSAVMGLSKGSLGSTRWERVCGKRLKYLKFVELKCFNKPTCVFDWYFGYFGDILWYIYFGYWDFPKQVANTSTCVGECGIGYNLGYLVIVYVGLLICNMRRQYQNKALLSLGWFVLR